LRSLSKMHFHVHMHCLINGFFYVPAILSFVHYPFILSGGDKPRPYIKACHPFVGAGFTPAPFIPIRPIRVLGSCRGGVYPCPDKVPGFTNPRSDPFPRWCFAA
jgi:hypothetical protein